MSDPKVASKCSKVLNDTHKLLYKINFGSARINLYDFPMFVRTSAQNRKNNSRTILISCEHTLIYVYFFSPAYYSLVIAVTSDDSCWQLIKYGNVINPSDGYCNQLT